MLFRFAIVALVGVGVLYVLYKPKKSGDNPSTEPQAKTIPPKPPAFKNITLALVLKGKDVPEAQSETSLTLADVVTLLEKANYFSCAAQQEINANLEELSFEGNEVDYISEQQQVVVKIDFEHTPSLVQGHIFRTKLEINNFLREGSTDFRIENKLVLTKISGLNQAGFIRT